MGREGGTGLGLATCFGIVRQMRGTIRFDSAVGHGTRFEILLPVAYGVAEPAPSRSPRCTWSRRTSRSRGAAARRSWWSTPRLLTDLHLPRQSGRELARALAAKRPGLRVLYVSGNIDAGAVGPHALAADDLLEKALGPPARAPRPLRVATTGARAPARRPGPRRDRSPRRHRRGPGRS